MVLSKREAEIFEKIDHRLVNGSCSCTAVEEVMGQAGRDSYAHHSRARHGFEGFQDIPTFSELYNHMKLAIRRERVADWLEWLEKGNQLNLYPVPKLAPMCEAQVVQQASQQGENQAAGRSNVSTDQRERVIVSGSEPRASASQAKDDVHRAISSGDPVIRSCVHQLIPTLGLHQLYSLVEQLYHLRYLERESNRKAAGDSTHD